MCYKLYEDFCHLFEIMIQVSIFYSIVREQYRLVVERKTQMPLSVATGSILLSLTDYLRVLRNDI